MNFKSLIFLFLMSLSSFAQEVDISLKSQTSLAEYGSIGQAPDVIGSDSWVYVDAEGRRYGLSMTSSGLAVFHYVQPDAPVIVGTVPGPVSKWQDIKTYKYPDGRAYAFIINQTSGSGVQVIDLNDLPNSVSLATVYDGIDRAHNIFIHPDQRNAYAYVCIASAGPRPGLVILDIADPMNIKEVGYWNDFSVHDAYVYHRWYDPNYDGKDMAVVWTEGNNISVIDLTDKTNPRTVSNLVYPNLAYSHSGWMDRTHRYAFATDEVDELASDINTTVRIIDLSNLENPGLISQWVGDTTAIDHNVFSLGDYVYLANYTKGLRIFDAHDPTNLVEIGSYDTFPSHDQADFFGAWTGIPFLGNGLVSLNDINDGHLILEVDFKPSADAEHRYYLPINPEKLEGQTRIRVVNPNESEVSFQIIAMNKDGVGTLAARRPLPSLNMMIMEPCDLFNNGTPADYDWVLIACADPLAVSLEGIQGDTAFATPAANSLSSALSVPHIAADTASFFTKAGIINGSAQVIDAKVTTAGAQSYDLELGDPETSQLVDFQNLFGGSINANQTLAKISATSDDNPVEGLAGIELFGGTQVAQMAGLTLNNDSSAIMVFPHIANTAADWWTGIAIVNQTDSDANLLIQAFNDSGAAVASEEKVLPAGGKLLDFVDNNNRGESLILGGIPETAGWLQVNADQPLSGYELFSDSQLRLFAGLQAGTLPYQNHVLPFGGTSDRYAGIAVLNPTLAAQTVTLDRISLSGQILGSETRTIEETSRLVVSANTLFGPTTESETWIRVRSDGPGVFAFVIYGPNDSSWLAGLNGQPYEIPVP